YAIGTKARWEAARGRRRQIVGRAGSVHRMGIPLMRAGVRGGHPGGGRAKIENSSSGNAAGNVHRSRHALNADTIREMHAAFRQGGREAIDKVMRTQPAVFLKLLVLLVPRQMTLDHSGGVKEMTDEQIERSIELIKEILAQREAAANAKVVEGTAETVALPAPDVVPDGPNKVMKAADTAIGPRERKPRKRKVPTPGVGSALGRATRLIKVRVAPGLHALHCTEDAHLLHSSRSRGERYQWLNQQLVLASNHRKFVSCARCVGLR